MNGQTYTFPEYDGTTCTKTAIWDEVKIQENDSITLPAAPKKLTYKFLGWKSNLDDSQIYDAGTSYSPSDNEILTAVWEKLPICIKATTLHAKSGANYGTLVSGDTIKSGDAFDCDVNGDEVYDPATERFYYVSDYFDTETKTWDTDTAVLIYYNRVKNGVSGSVSTAYNNSTRKNVDGPLTAITHLPTTGQWKNVSLKNQTRIVLSDMNEEGNEIDYTGYSTRFLTVQELARACNLVEPISKRTDLRNCTYFLEDSSNGYYLENWVSLNNPNNRNPNNNYVWTIYSNSDATNNTSTTSSMHGTRPVIEIDKDSISIE